MGVALLSAKRSKDPSTQVGACIVNNKNKIVGAGYNGLPIGCDDDDFPWEKEGEFMSTKYPYICHAELNAILNNIGIYLSDKYEGNDVFKVSRLMLEKAGVKYRKVEVKITNLVLSFKVEDV